MFRFTLRQADLASCAALVWNNQVNQALLLSQKSGSQGMIATEIAEGKTRIAVFVSRQ